MPLGGIENNQFAQTRLILEVKFGDDSFSIFIVNSENIHHINLVATAYFDRIIIFMGVPLRQTNESFDFA